MTTAACNGGRNKCSRKNASNTKGSSKMESNKFKELAAIDVGAYIEKKGGMSYLSWPFAVDALMRHDPQATWEFLDPVAFGKTLMVSCRVTAFGKTMQMHLPVMDNRNQAIADPNAFDVNKAMMRCLVKCIAVHGIGLYIYAGEDLPVDDSEKQIADVAPPPEKTLSAAMKERLQRDAEQIEEIMESMPDEAMSIYNAIKALGIDETVYAWGHLSSKTRSAIKKHGQQQ